MSANSAPRAEKKPLEAITSQTNLFRWLRDLDRHLRENDSKINDIHSFVHALVIKDAPLEEVPNDTAPQRVEATKTFCKIRSYLQAFVQNLPECIMEPNNPNDGNRNALDVLAEERDIIGLRDLIVATHLINHPQHDRAAMVGKRVIELKYKDGQPISILLSDINALVELIHDVFNMAEAVTSMNSLLNACKNCFYNTQVVGLQGLGITYDLVNSQTVAIFVTRLRLVQSATLRSGMLKEVVVTTMLAAEVLPGAKQNKREREGQSAGSGKDTRPICIFCRDSRPFDNRIIRHDADKCWSNPKSPAAKSDYVESCARKLADHRAGKVPSKRSRKFDEKA